MCGGGGGGGGGGGLRRARAWGGGGAGQCRTLTPAAWAEGLEGVWGGSGGDEGGVRRDTSASLRAFAAPLGCALSERAMFGGHVASEEGGGGFWHKASVSDCLPLAAPIGLSPLLIPTLCEPERVLVVSMEPPDDLSCLTTPGGRPPRRRAVARAVDPVHRKGGGCAIKAKGTGGAAWRLQCIAVRSRRYLWASRHFPLSFPWPLALCRRRCLPASLPQCPLSTGLALPLHPPPLPRHCVRSLWVGGAHGAPGMSLSRCSESGPHGGGQGPLALGGGRGGREGGMGHRRATPNGRKRGGMGEMWSGVGTRRIGGGGMVSLGVPPGRSLVPVSPPPGLCPSLPRSAHGCLTQPHRRACLGVGPPPPFWGGRSATARSRQTAPFGSGTQNAPDIGASIAGGVRCGRATAFGGPKPSSPSRETSRRQHRTVPRVLQGYESGLRTVRLPFPEGGCPTAAKAGWETHWTAPTTSATPDFRALGWWGGTSEPYLRCTLLHALPWNRLSLGVMQRIASHHQSGCGWGANV